MHQLQAVVCVLRLLQRGLAGLQGVLHLRFVHYSHQLAFVYALSFAHQHLADGARAREAERRAAVFLYLTHIAGGVAAALGGNCFRANFQCCFPLAFLLAACREQCAEQENCNQMSFYHSFMSFVFGCKGRKKVSSWRAWR